MMMFITKAHDDDVLLKLIEICSLLMVREKVGFIENTARRHRWGG